MSGHSFLEVVPFEEAAPFLDYLSPAHPRWGAGDSPTWVFRGHADANWVLLPSSRRAETRKILEPLLRRFSGRTPHFDWNSFLEAVDNRELLASSERARSGVVRTYAQAEMHAVYDFARHADELGFRLPTHYTELENIPAYLDRFIPTANAAYAQHHGIPTPLIDWTRRPRVAAFFAAKSLDASNQPAHLAVWALDIDRVVQPRTLNQMESVIRTLTCPRSDHGFLHAQDGLFTWFEDYRHLNFMMNNGRWMTIVDVLAEHYTNLDGVVLRKCTLPRSRVGDLRRLLLRERVSRAHLMPNFDNVALSVIDRWALSE